ncbi:MAG: type II toxin-antitoxin system VapC family toxin [Thiobacillaceae bacterium]
MLDTQLAIWWQIAPERLPPRCAELVLDADNSAYVSRISLWEIAIKIGIGKLHLDLPQFISRMTDDGFTWLGLEDEHIIGLSGLLQQDDHKDPFDRLLVAQSLTEPMILLTTDAKLARYGPTVRIV